MPAHNAVRVYAAHSNGRCGLTMTDSHPTMAGWRAKVWPAPDEG